MQERAEAFVNRSGLAPGDEPDPALFPVENTAYRYVPDFCRCISSYDVFSSETDKTSSAVVI
jgi:hypothetical protein